MSYEACSLEEILAARDARRDRQMQLLHAYPEPALVCLTVVMPGVRKCNAHTKTIGDAACKAIRETFKDCMLFPEAEADIGISRISKTGYEAFFLVSLPVPEAKRKATEIEDTHALGRLFDIDIIGNDGVPVSRTQIGRKPRLCLLCNSEARLCMRRHTHTSRELLEKISDIVSAWDVQNEKTSEQ